MPSVAAAARGQAFGPKMSKPVKSSQGFPRAGSVLGSSSPLVGACARGGAPLFKRAAKEGELLALAPSSGGTVAASAAAAEGAGEPAAPRLLPSATSAAMPSAALTPPPAIVFSAASVVAWPLSAGAGAGATAPGSSTGEAATPEASVLSSDAALPGSSSASSSAPCARVAPTAGRGGKEAVGASAGSGLGAKSSPKPSSFARPLPSSTALANPTLGTPGATRVSASVGHCQRGLATVAVVATSGAASGSSAGKVPPPLAAAT
mmetsp:Transcript_55859/g.154687  ORF Transcript_55859/g.154687 Transcript_55859/m.154687 type:complete len:263 (+) Transcript_55859:207-995(+)